MIVRKRSRKPKQSLKLLSKRHAKLWNFGRTLTHKNLHKYDIALMTNSIKVWIELYQTDTWILWNRIVSPKKAPVFSFSHSIRFIKTDTLTLQHNSNKIGHEGKFYLSIRDLPFIFFLRLNFDTKHTYTIQCKKYGKILMKWLIRLWRVACNEYWNWRV